MAQWKIGRLQPAKMDGSSSMSETSAAETMIPGDRTTRVSIIRLGRDKKESPIDKIVGIQSRAKSCRIGLSRRLFAPGV